MLTGKERKKEERIQICKWQGTTVSSLLLESVVKTLYNHSKGTKDPGQSTPTGATCERKLIYHTKARQMAHAEVRRGGVES